MIKDNSLCTLSAFTPHLKHGVYNIPDQRHDSIFGWLEITMDMRPRYIIKMLERDIGQTMFKWVKTSSSLQRL